MARRPGARWWAAGVRRRSGYSRPGRTAFGTAARGWPPGTTPRATRARSA